MASKELRETIESYFRYYEVNGAVAELCDAMYQATNVAILGEKDIEYGLFVGNKAKEYIREYIAAGTGANLVALELEAQKNGKKYEILDKYYAICKLLAPYQFESYLEYMEKDRSVKKRFYTPRAKTLKVVVDDLQDLEDGKIVFYGLSMPPRVGKSTICIFFLSWVMGKNPNLHNAMGGHSGPLAKGFYKEILNIITSKDYKFAEIFPKSKLQEKSAEDYIINLDKPDRFATLTCRGIEGTWTGAIDISNGGYLYVDDLIRDRQESLSQIRLNTKYQDYLNVMVDRKNDGAKELMVGTRWNLYDVLGRCEAEYKNNSNTRFRKIPALDENDKSNFEYDFGVGFSSQYYIDLRKRLDSNEWFAKYQQKPFLREGLLFSPDELEYYDGTLPDGEYSCQSVIDPAFGGGDNLSMPVGIKIGEKVYIPDWVYNNSDKYVTRPLVVGSIIRNNISSVQIEGNLGGEEYAEGVKKDLKDHGYSIDITTLKANNKQSKEDKIIQYSSDVKRHFVFLKPELQSPEYRKAMDDLTTYTSLGKNLHDDAPDSIVELYKKMFKVKVRKAVIMESIF